MGLMHRVRGTVESRVVIALQVLLNFFVLVPPVVNGGTLGNAGGFARGAVQRSAAQRRRARNSKTDSIKSKRRA